MPRAPPAKRPAHDRLQLLGTVRDPGQDRRPCRRRRRSRHPTGDEQRRAGCEAGGAAGLAPGPPRRAWEARDTLRSTRLTRPARSLHRGRERPAGHDREGVHTPQLHEARAGERKRPSAGWYGSVAVPRATSSRCHDGGRAHVRAPRRCSASRGSSAVAVVRRTVGSLLEVADEQNAAVHAAHVGVERPLERHATDLRQRRLARLDSVLDPHPSSIEHMFAHGKAKRGPSRVARWTSSRGDPPRHAAAADAAGARPRLPPAGRRRLDARRHRDRASRREGDVGARARAGRRDGRDRLRHPLPPRPRRGGGRSPRADRGAVVQGALDYAQCELVWGNPAWSERLVDWFRLHGAPDDVTDGARRAELRLPAVHPLPA